MKKLLVIWLLFPTVLFAQNNIRECVFSHLSSSELLVGETLHFKNYVFSQQTGKLSALSRILYVEILNTSGSPVYQTKLLIEDGQSASSYFVPSDLETGNYQFVAYTRWMKNFNQYFNQPITIVNPYVSQKFHAATRREMKVNLTVEGGALLADAKNKIALRVVDQFQRGFKTKGRVVSRQGKESIEVMTDDYGFGGFYLTPEAGENYRLILENGDGFEFIDLPQSCIDCTLFRVIQTADLVVVRTKSGDEDELTQGKLEIFKNQEKVYTSPMVLNTTFSIAKNTLPDGLLSISYTEASGKVRERLFWNGGEKANNSNQLKEYAGNSEITLNFPSLKESDLSISVEQVEDPEEEPNFFWYAALGSKIAQKIPNSFFESATAEQLDHLLIGSNYSSSVSNPSQVKFLPEFRAGIVQGTAFYENGKPAFDIPLGLSFSGTDRQLDAAMTDSVGQFVLTYDPLLSAGEPAIDILSNEENININLEPEFYTSFPIFESAPLVFDSMRVAAIIERSIHNQIMNAYYIQAEQEVLKVKSPQFDKVKSYKLDDFTRFATMRDTFIELIVEVGVSKNEEKYSFKMRSQDLVNGFYKEYPTLLLLDGAFVSAEDLMNLSPYLVDRIDVINHKYYFGKIILDGIISVHTLAEDVGILTPKGWKVDLVPVEVNQARTPIQVNTESHLKIPAYQDLLYWNPKVQHPGGSLELKFSTSTVSGMFEVRLEGVAQDGTAVSQNAHFKVN